MKIKVTEKAWQRQVLDLARLLKWRVYHPWISIHSQSGWPDLALVRERLVLAELKSEDGTLSPSQREWLKSLQGAKVEVYVWRPSDWDEIVKVLR